jgi:hypothetical protein
MNCQFIKEYENHEWSEISNSRPSQEPLTMTPTAKRRQQLTTKAPRETTMKAPEPVTHDFPYLDKRDLPENGRRIGTIIRPPQITETKWGNKYRIAVQFENGERRRWSMNNTTFNNLLVEFGKTNQIGSAEACLSEPTNSQFMLKIK